MNYQKIKLLDGKTVILDKDAKRTRCSKCKELIRFGITKDGKYLPISEIGNKYQSHFLDCEKQEETNLEKNIRQQQNNEEYLSEL
jgi:invasion protein IalB